MDLSLADWNQKALDTAADARNRFLTLVKARESLATRKASLAVARRVHEENEARVKAGVLAAFELQDSELGVLAREKDLLDAELAERDAADQLRLTLHLPPETVLELPDTPWTDVPDPSEKESLEVALRRRPDLAKARTSLRTAEFNEEVSRNLALPALSVEGSAGVAGTATELRERDRRHGDREEPELGGRSALLRPAGEQRRAGRPRRRAPEGEPGPRRWSPSSRSRRVSRSGRPCGRSKRAGSRRRFRARGCPWRKPASPRS